MIYASVCSGVEAASLAWEPLGWKPAWFSEIEPFPSAVLQHRWPKVPNLGDMTKINGNDYHETIDLLVGGTPCQSFSVAGKRLGLEDERGQLMLHFVRLAYQMQTRWVVWENVPGCLSQDGGRAFATLLSSLVGYDVDVPTKGWRNFGIVTGAPGCYGVAWRIIDAQYARVDGFQRAIPQRRRRIFVVGYFGDWRRAAEVLFEHPGLLGNNPPRRSKREEITGNTERNALGSGTAGPLAVGERVICVHGSQDPICNTERANAVNRNNGLENCVCAAFMGGQGSKAGGIAYSEHVSPSIKAAPSGGNQVPDIMCYENHMQDSRVKDCGECSPSINAKAGTGGGNLPLVQFGRTVRRLLPVECERLMGFPDNHTRIPWKGKPEEECPDSPRYKACGNSMCVNAMEWIGHRIKAVEAKTN